MNVFYEKLPDFVAINEKEYKVITDYREWIRFSDMLKSDIPGHLKEEYLLDMFVDEKPDISTEITFEQTIQGITGFLNLSDIQLPIESSGERCTTRTSISYEYDAQYIIAAFMRDYGINLLKVPYLHWWEFKMLFNGLDEKNQIKEYIYYRTVDIGKVKDAEERKRILNIRRSIEIPDDKYASDGDIGNAF